MFMSHTMVAAITLRLNYNLCRQEKGHDVEKCPRRTFVTIFCVIGRRNIFFHEGPCFETLSERSSYPVIPVDFFQQTGKNFVPSDSFPFCCYSQSNSDWTFTSLQKATELKILYFVAILQPHVKNCGNLHPTYVELGRGQCENRAKATIFPPNLITLWKGFSLISKSV